MSIKAARTVLKYFNYFEENMHDIITGIVND